MQGQIGLIGLIGISGGGPLWGRNFQHTQRTRGLRCTAAEYLRTPRRSQESCFVVWYGSCCGVGSPLRELPVSGTKPGPVQLPKANRWGARPCPKSILR